jgi:hypothetical protein
MKLLAWANLALAFLLELTALYLLGYWGFHSDFPAFWRWVWGLGAPALFLWAWRIWAAPKSKRRLKGWRLWAYKAAVFSSAILALGALGQTQRALVFGAVVLVNLILLWLWQRFEPA